MFVKLDLDSLLEMANILSKSFLIRGLEIGEIIPIPVWIIPFPVYKTGIELHSKTGGYLNKEFF